MFKSYKIITIIQNLHLNSSQKIVLEIINTPHIINLKNFYIFNFKYNLEV